MKYRLLGNSGLRVSEAALGTMTFGDEWGWGSPKDEARKVYDAFREAGGNFIDTANFYTNGASESFLGEFIKDHRQSVVLATKYSNAAPGTDPNAAGNQRKNMMQAVEASLKRLHTDYIDLYWVHIWDQITPVEEVMRGLDDLIRQGKVLYVGISDAPAWWIARRLKAESIVSPTDGNCALRRTYPTGTKHDYRAYALPIGHPETAAICGKMGCEEPGSCWLPS
jgi:aryl-alcohol dehydrogenase-like predicted oxidoreductase